MLSCSSCRTDLAEVEATVHLDGQHHLLFCPLCGANLGPYRSERIFFDEKAAHYWYWVSEDPDHIKTIEDPQGLFRILIDVHTLRLSACLFDRLLLLRGIDEPIHQPDPPHFSPVRPECEYLLRSCVPLDHLNVTMSSRTYRVTTSTGWTDIATAPATEIRQLEAGRGSALYVWPNFVVPGWKLT